MCGQKQTHAALLCSDWHFIGLASRKRKQTRWWWWRWQQLQREEHAGNMVTCSTQSYRMVFGDRSFDSKLSEHRTSTCRFADHHLIEWRYPNWNHIRRSVQRSDQDPADTPPTKENEKYANDLEMIASYHFWLFTQRRQCTNQCLLAEGTMWHRMNVRMNMPKRLRMHSSIPLDKRHETNEGSCAMNVLP